MGKNMKPDKFYSPDKYKEYEKAAQKYANSLNISIKERLGEGNWGVAFLSSDGTVIKATTDPIETYNALLLKDKELHNVANIYDVYHSPNEDIAIIKQERVKKLNLLQEKMYKTTLRKLNDGDQSFLSFDEMFFEDDGIELTEKELQLAKEISYGINEIYNNDGTAEDVDITNTGVNSKGQFVIFDQKSVSEDPAKYIEKLNKLKEKKKVKVKP